MEGRSGVHELDRRLFVFKSIVAARRRVFAWWWLAMFRGRAVARWRRVALRRPLDLAFAHLLLALHVHRTPLLLHLHRALLLNLALLLHLLLAGLLLCGLRALALLRLHLRLPLLLHLLLARALLCGLIALRLHLRLPGLFACALLLRLFLKLTPLLLFPLLRLDSRLRLLRGRAIAGWLRRTLDRPHHGQAAGLRRVALRFVGWPDHRRARQGFTFTGMREACAGQFARAPDGLRRLVARGDRVHGVPERFGGAGTADRRLRGPRRDGGAHRLIARCRFCGACRRRAVACIGDGRHQLDAFVAKRCRGSGLAQILHLRGREWLAVLTGYHFFSRREIDRPRRRLVSRDHRPRERLATLEQRRTWRRLTQTDAGLARIDVGTQGHFAARELRAVQLQHRGVHRTCAGEHVPRHRSDRARHPAIGVVVATTR